MIDSFAFISALVLAGGAAGGGDGGGKGGGGGGGDGGGGGGKSIWISGSISAVQLLAFFSNCPTNVNHYSEIEI